MEILQRIGGFGIQLFILLDISDRNVLGIKQTNHTVANCFHEEILIAVPEFL